ncbi:MAG: hypothetical protein ABI836_10330 [Gemmatimonadota bacterium]
MQRRCRFHAGSVAVLLLGLATAPCSAQVDPGDAPLVFAGFTPGDPLTRLAATLREHEGHHLRCTRSRSDSTVQECHSSYTDSASRRSVEVWLSAIAENAAILILKTEGSLAQLERWRGDLITRYGRVSTRVQGPQRMMQWVRSGRMIRLTWRLDRAAPAISVSLVDGHILDGWGQKRE